jgi:hypothetical protein
LQYGHWKSLASTIHMADWRFPRMRPLSACALTESLRLGAGECAAAVVAGADELARELADSRRAAPAPLQARAATKTAASTRNDANMSVFEREVFDGAGRRLHTGWSARKVTRDETCHEATWRA